MKTNLQSRIVIDLVAGVLLFCCVAAAQEPGAPATAPAVSAPYAGATISDFKGKVSIQLPHQGFSEPARGAMLPPETTINTEDGRLLLKLADGSDILVRAHTKIVLKQPETNAWRYLQVLVGRIHNEIRKHLGGTPPLQIGTPSAVISVRGTKFDVEVDRRGNTEVDVEEGVVELDSLARAGESVVLTAGFSSRVGMETGPESPRPTHDLRPELDRPRHNDGKDSQDDDPIKRLEASDRDRHDHSDSHGGGDSRGSGSGGGSSSGGGGQSGSDGGQSGSDGGQSSGGSDSGDHHSGGGKPPAE